MERPNRIPALAAVVMAMLLLAVVVARKPARKAPAPPPPAAIVEEFDEDESPAPRGGGRARRSSLDGGSGSRVASGGTTGALVTSIERDEGLEGQKARAAGDGSIFGRTQSRREEMTPVPGAVVELYENDPLTRNPPLRTTVSDAEGSFTIAGLNDGNRRYILVAKAAGRVPVGRRVLVDRVPAEVDLDLERGVPLSGTVVDRETSVPVEGATVFQPVPIGNEAAFMLGTAVSGAGGRFDFAAVPKGKLMVRAEKDGYSPGVATVDSPTDAAVVPMAAGGSLIKGVTVSRTTGQPVGGSKVYLRDTSGGPATEALATTLAKGDGTFEFTDVPPAAYEVSAVRGGLRGKPAVKVELARGETRDDVTVKVPDDLFVTGRTVNDRDDKAVPGVRVYFKGPRGDTSVTSDEDGRFAFQTVAMDEYTLEVHERGYLPVQEPGAARDAATTGAVETITRKVPEGASSDDVTIRMRRVPALGGIVKMAEAQKGKPAGQPVWGANVTVDYKIEGAQERVATRTDVEGRYFVNVPARKRGDARVSAQYNGAVAVANAKLPARGDVNLGLKWTRAQGKVLLSDRSALSGIRMRTRLFLLADREPKDNTPLPGGSFITRGDGGYTIPVGEHQKVEFTYEMPDDRQVTKVFDTDELLRGKRLDVYDPLSGDVVSEFQGKPRDRATPTPTPADGGGRRGRGGPGGGAGGQLGGSGGRGGRGQGGNP